MTTIVPTPGRPHPAGGRPPSSTDVAALADEVAGVVLRPGQDGFDDERSGFQTAFHHAPDVIVGAASADDVAAAVRFAAARSLPVAVQSTGHGTSVLADGGVLVTTGRMDSVSIDPGARTARVGAGARWEQVVARAELFGLVTPSGSAGSVGVAGYTLAGGMGLLGRELGYAADRVRSFEIVTADGRVRTVTPDSEPDLFWAVRGGRDNFGIVTELEIELHPARRIYGGGIFYDAADAATVLAHFRAFTADAPDEITTSVGTMTYPDIPVFSEPLRGRSIVHVRFATTDLSGGPKLVNPWLEVATPLFTHLGELAYSDGGSIYREPTFAHSYDGNSVLLAELPDEALDAIRELAGPTAPVPTVVDLRHLGGALGRAPEVANAVPFRDAAYILRLLSALDGQELDEVRAAHRAVEEVVAPWTLGRALNFAYGDRGAEELVGEMFDADTLARLRRVKTAYDPHDMFRVNHHVTGV